MSKFRSLYTYTHSTHRLRQRNQLAIRNSCGKLPAMNAQNEGSGKEEESSAAQNLHGLSSFFSRSRKSKLTARLRASFKSSVGEGDQDAHDDKSNRIWLSIRPWVCLQALVERQRAYPVCDLGCEDWEEEGASERAAMAHEQKDAGPADAFAWTAAMVVSLPPECLARALEFIHGDVSTVYAPLPRKPLRSQPTSETKAGQARNWQCCRYLLSQRSCLHGRVVQSGRTGRSLSLGCWYLGCLLVGCLDFKLFGLPWSLQHLG